MIGINQDDKADGRGKAGLTFQAISYITENSPMNTAPSNSGGWRDSQLRKDLNDNKSGIIWNAIASDDFKNNITPVIKITNNNANGGKSNSSNTSNASSITSDKLWILSPSEMGMPVVSKKGMIIANRTSIQTDVDVHVYDGDSRYDNTVKYNGYGNKYREWHIEEDYLYSNDSYQWWMLPTGDRKINGNQSYHDTDSYSYCNVAIGLNPSSNKDCYNAAFWLRSADNNSYFHWTFANFAAIYSYNHYERCNVIPAFSF